MVSNFATVRTQKGDYILTDNYNKLTYTEYNISFILQSMNWRIKELLNNKIKSKSFS